ncbi:MAG: tyrosine-type recombinase/integrase, partial [Sulfurovum sp.]|nr:tyrosine-type recombinase/integrase [Sulfurovum sp.]
YLNEDEIALLLKTIDEHPKMRKKELIKLFTVLALSTGARLTSVLTITQGDILEDKIRIKDHKNNTTYYAALHSSVKVLLPTGLKSTDYVVGARSKQLHRVSINKMLQPRLNELFNEGLDLEDSKRRVVIHTFRHTFGSLLAIGGVGIYTIKKLMNHSDIKMTMRYAKLSPDVGFDAVKNLNI